MSGDLGEAADYILAERPALAEDTVWAVLNELGAPPAAGADGLAADLVRASRPALSRRDVSLVLREWRAYESLAGEPDWDEE